MKQFFFFSLFICIGCQSLATMPPSGLKIASLTAEKWMGGRPESGFGYTLQLVLEKPLPKNIQLISITYKNATATINQQAETVFMAKTIVQNTDYQLDNDSIKEQHNPKPSPQTNDLKPNEALITYTQNNQPQTLLFSNITEKEPLLMP